MADNKGDNTRHFTRSLSGQIALMYMLLAMVNIIFFSVMIYDNITDLQKNNYKLQSDNLIGSVLEELQKMVLTKKRDQNYEGLEQSLLRHDVVSFRIFDADGKVWHRLPETVSEPIPDSLRLKTMEISGDNPVYRTRFYRELDTENFSVKFLLPLNARDDIGNAVKVFIDASMSVESMRESQQTVYTIILIAASWGILFHILFGIYVYRLIFVRVEILTNSSDRMAEGDLATRAEWKRKRNDELDVLGNAFNTMAERIEDQVKTVTRLNHEIQNELEIGKEVQEFFLPKQQFFSDYSFALYFRPMREVSGDIYNFYNYKSGAKGLFFADATGHGVSAALVTTITVLSLDEIMKTTGKPDHVLHGLNNVLGKRLESSFFATGVFLKISTESLIISNAGHNSPLLIRSKGGEIEELERNGPPLGMIEDYEYDSREIPLSPGDRLLVYSDGLVETVSPAGLQFGLDEVKNIINSNRELSTESLKTLLADTLDRHSGGIYTDDVSILLLEVPG